MSPAEDRKALCRTHSEAASGRTLSAAVGTGARAARAAAVADSPPQAGGESLASEERTATPGAEPGGAEEGAAGERGWATSVARAAAGTLGSPAAAIPAGPA